MFAAEFDVGDVALAMLWFSILALWLILALRIFGDILRSDDLSGLAKAGWTFLVFGLPYVGVLSYLYFRGDKIGSRLGAMVLPDPAGEEQGVDEKS